MEGHIAPNAVKVPFQEVVRITKRMLTSHPPPKLHLRLKNTHFSYSALAPSTALKNSSIPIPMSEDTPTA